MDRYLDRLPVRRAPATRRARPHAGRVLPSAAWLVVLGLLAGTGLVVAGLTHLVGGAADEGVSQPAGAGCLSTSAEALVAFRVRGRAGLCVVDGGVEWELELEHLTGRASYAAWLATFEHPDQCRFGALAHYIPGSRQPCTLVDLSGPNAQASPQWLAETVADAGGIAHINGLLRDAHVPPRAQTWLLVAPTSPIHGAAARADWVARAVFDLP
jgi:hypothetical protein